MTFSDKAFSLKNSSGESIYGIVHHPHDPNGMLALMFNIGLHYRVCHSRLFVRQARDLQNTGFTVVRFDSTRIGYSHGEIPCGRAIDSFDQIQTGLFKEDSLLVLDYCRQNLEPRGIFFIGLCGGGLTAIITAALAENIDGVVFIAGPVTVTSSSESDTLHPFEADVYLKSYLFKALSFKSWGRFFTGKTSYNDIYSSIKVKIADKLSFRKKTANTELIDTENIKESKGEIYNMVFNQAFNKLMISGKNILFIMPELDRATYDFDKYFMPVLKNLPEYKAFYQISRIAKADHTFSRPESSQLLIRSVREWLIETANKI